MNRRRAPNRLKSAAPAHAGAAAGSLRPRFRAWRTQHRYAFFSSLGRLLARPWATLMTLAVLSLALTLPLLCWLLLDNAGSLTGHLARTRTLSVYLKTDRGAEIADKLAQRLRARADVTGVAIRTPQQGLAELRAQSGFAEALKVLHYNPLPIVLIVSLPAVDTDVVAAPALVGVLQHDADVDLVQYDAQWRRRLDAVLGVARRGGAVLAVLLALAALLVIGNTVRLDIQGRSEEIAVMQLLGASDGFVRRPFLYTGFWYGALAGLFGLALTALTEWTLAGPLERLAASYAHRFSVHGLSWTGMLVALIGSVVLGWAGAGFAASRHIAMGQPR